MTKFFTFLLISLFAVFSGQTFVQAYKNRADLVTQANINTYLQELAALGVKTTGSAANTNALNWLKNKYTSFGYTESEISEHTFSYNSSQSKNLIITKTGTVYPNQFVIICGHYDTINGPGVNDNGSGVAVILEIARILKNVQTDYSIKFINFSGEEQGLLGSQAYVNNVVNATNPKMNIKLVLNIDQVGAVAGSVNNTITCERDLSSPSANNSASNTATQQLMTCVGLYSPLETNLARAYGSDYMPFQANGEIITGLYETNESNFPHTSNDIFANMDPVYVMNVAKAAVGAAQFFANASTSTLAVSEHPSDQILNSLKIVPNPAETTINIEFMNNLNQDFTFDILDSSGRKLITSKNQKAIDVKTLKTGIYLGKLTIDDMTTSRKIIIK